MTPIRLRVKELREAKGWSQAELARQAEIRRATLIAIEAGTTKGVEFDTLERLAAVFGVDASYLLIHEKPAPRGKTR